MTRPRHGPAAPASDTGMVRPKMRIRSRFHCVLFRMGTSLAGCGKTRLWMVGLVEESATMRVTHREEARMRGDDHQQAGMWSYIAPEQRVPADHPLRPLRAMVDTILAELSPAFAP